MHNQRMLTAGFLLPRAATFAVLVAIVGCDAGRDTDDIVAPRSEAAPAEVAAAESRPDYTDRVTTSKVPPPDRERDAYGRSAKVASSAQYDEVRSAIARVNPTSQGKAEGSVTFSIGADAGGMLVSVDLQGMEPGLHGFHIHEVGDCSAADASSAGEHFNPGNTVHGSPDAEERHAGDMGNIEADADGRVAVELTLQGLALAGPTSILQKAVVIHSKNDDLQSQPAGDAGDRVGCGVIGMATENAGRAS